MHEGHPWFAWADYLGASCCDCRQLRRCETVLAALPGHTNPENEACSLRIERSEGPCAVAAVVKIEGKSYLLAAGHWDSLAVIGKAHTSLRAA